MEFNRNNLDKAFSPYLKQHKDSPIWWQEWKQEVIGYAKEKNKILFASVGYSASHLCHVMASEAFSDEKIAGFLNQHFVSIKVDREERPDIDKFLMSLSISTTGRSGWPLNVFLSSDLRPITASTYAPLTARQGVSSFPDILQKVKRFYEEKKSKLLGFSMPIHTVKKVSEDEIKEGLVSGFDLMYGGVGTGAKSPPHSQLIFILYYFETKKDNRLKKLLETTLNMMLLRGLHDHIQGGFFRECIDRQWTIPHFEKMLYDQGYLLWVYSMAYKLLGNDSYRTCAKKIVRCLEETFEDDGLFYSAHDADTDQWEGAVYLWSDEELRDVLSILEYKRFVDVYGISEKGNFDGKNHLIKKKDLFLDDIEEKLLKIREKRAQPFVDKKIITSFNCLTGVGLINSCRYIGDTQYLKKAEDIFEQLINRHFKDGKLFHSSINGFLQKEEFLEDYAALLLLVTFLHEETGNYGEYLEGFYDKLLVFKKDGEQWVESDNVDFPSVPAQILDYPLASSASIANLAVARAEVLLDKKYSAVDFHDPLNAAFFNISGLIRNGYFYIIKNTEKTRWKNAPINTMQVKADQLSVSYRSTSKDKLP